MRESDGVRLNTWIYSGSTDARAITTDGTNLFVGVTGAIHATANADHTFVNWSATSGITFASSTSANTRMTVTGSGTVTATLT